MTYKIGEIPAERRWEITSKALTGTIVVYGEALRSAIGNEKYIEFLKNLWGKAGENAKQFSESIGVSVENAQGIAEASKIFASISMGPELEYEDLEVGEDKYVGRTTKCPWHERHKEQGVSEIKCNSGHQSWGECVTGNLNPKFSFNLTKSIPAGDEYCEYVIERKS